MPLMQHVYHGLALSPRPVRVQHRPRWGQHILLLLLALTACAPRNDTTEPSDTLGQGRQAELAASASPEAPAANQNPVKRRPALGGGTVGTTVELPDSAWTGGYQSAEPSTPSGGLATAVYGTRTQYNVLQASFLVEAQPFGTVELSLDGMDAPGADKTPIIIAINDQEIYNGPNLLPDSDEPADEDAWGSYSWSFNAQMLHPGHNTITIRNLADGALHQAPFVLLDYGELTYQAR